LSLLDGAMLRRDGAVMENRISIIVITIDSSTSVMPLMARFRRVVIVRFILTPRLLGERESGKAGP